MRVRVAVCIATYNRADRLERLLAALDSQQMDERDEVVVYDDASTDATSQVLDSWTCSTGARLTPLRGSTNRGPAHGRNACWRTATAPLVLFIDDDCQPAAGWVTAHRDAFAEHQVTVGRTLPHPEQMQSWGPFSRSMRVEDTRFFQTCNIGYPRALLERVGGFDEEFRKAAGEDTDLGYRAIEAGAAAAFLPAALVHHDVRPSSLRAALREATKWDDIPLFARRHPSAAGAALYGRLWWKRSHPVTVLALAGAALALAGRPLALLGFLPWLRLRTGAGRVAAPLSAWPWVLPGQFAVDVVEVATLARGSVRHRKVLL